MPCPRRIARESLFVLCLFVGLLTVLAQAAETPKLTPEETLQLAQAAIAAADQAYRLQDELVALVTSFSADCRPTTAAMDKLAAIQSLLAGRDYRAALAKATTTANGVYTQVQAQLQPSALGAGAKPPEDLTQARDELAKRTQKLRDCAPGLAQCQDRLYPALADKLMDDVAKQMKSLGDLAQDATADAVLKQLPAAIGPFADCDRTLVRLDQIWPGLHGPLAALAPDRRELSVWTKGFESKLSTAKQTRDQIVAKLSGWMTAVLGDDRPVSVSTRLTDLRQLAGGCRELLTQLQPRADEYRGTIEFGTARLQAASLLALAEAITPELARLQALLGTNESEFVFARVDLYYLTDVMRLMQMLTNTQEVPRWGGEALDAAKQAAVAARKVLFDAETALVQALEKQGECATRQKQLKEDLRLARNGRDDAKDQLDAAKKTKAGIDKKLEAADLSEDDRAKLKKEQEAAAQAQADKQKDYDAADKKVKDLEGEQDGMPGKVQQAKDDLAQAKAIAEAKRKALIAAVQVEQDTRAAVHDAPPLLIVKPCAGDTNACKRIYLYAFADQSTLFLYGRPEDVDTARTRVAQLDRPCSQAKLTLWALELTTGGRKALKMNNAIAMVDRELAYTRSCNAAAVATLRSCIGEQVASAASKAPLYGGTDTERLRRYHFYSPPVCEAMGFAPRTTNSVTDEDELADAAATWLTQWTLPDPAATTTLGEALMVLSLAKSTYRAEVIAQFNKRLGRSLEELGRAENAAARGTPLPTSSSPSPPTCSPQPPPFPERDVSCNFARLYGCLVGNGSKSDSLAWQLASKQAKTAATTDRQRVETADAQWEQFEKAIDDNEMTAAQLEIVRAMQRVALANIQRYAHTALPQLASATEADYRTGVAKLNPMLMWLWEQFAILAPPLPQVPTSARLAEFDRQLRSQTEHRFPDAVLNARVAAANQMLKEMVCAFDDDLDCHFVRPMLDRIRLDLRRSEIRVGIVQRTSVLGMNRQYSHVGATSTAQLALGQEIDALAEAQQAINLYTSVQTSGIWAAIGGLKNLPADKQPEFYGLTTRGAFEVTPVVDPSGQALHFRLRHIQCNEVREPNGTVNQQMPRIERHTVDTEVQLTSTEIREISRYSANEALGLPRVKTGGLPILKHLPLLEELPLIGWFTLRHGKDASVQESLILGQTTVYPTIQEMMDLLLTGCPTEPTKAAE